ncbi:hypothetical protein U9M48_009143, partial [Paspalum notatum var. saurae]
VALASGRGLNRGVQVTVPAQRTASPRRRVPLGGRLASSRAHGEQAGAGESRSGVVCGKRSASRRCAREKEARITSSRPRSHPVARQLRSRLETREGNRKRRRRRRAAAASIQPRPPPAGNLSAAEESGPHRASELHPSAHAWKLLPRLEAPPAPRPAFWSALSRQPPSSAWPPCLAACSLPSRFWRDKKAEAASSRGFGDTKICPKTTTAIRKEMKEYLDSNRRKRPLHLDDDEQQEEADVVVVEANPAAESVQVQEDAPQESQGSKVQLQPSSGTAAKQRRAAYLYKAPTSSKSNSKANPKANKSIVEMLRKNT